MAMRELSSTLPFPWPRPARADTVAGLASAYLFTFVLVMRLVPGLGGCGRPGADYPGMLLPPGRRMSDGGR
jgi:hypothetical protein